MAPIFLVGTMRSGTTLLRLILDSHERLAIANESGFLRAVAAAKVIPDQHDGADWYRRFGVSDQEMNERLRAFYDDIFSSWAHSQGKVRWGDKTPFHIDQLPLMNQIFPDAAVVGIIRHPGAVVASQMRRGRDFASAVRSWRRSNLRLVRAAARPPLRDHVTVLRYEDLVGDPEGTLRQLLDFLQEDWSPNLLRHHEVHRERGGPAVAEGGTRSWDPIDAESGQPMDAGTERPPASGHDYRHCGVARGVRLRRDRRAAARAKPFAVRRRPAGPVQGRAGLGVRP